MGDFGFSAAPHRSYSPGVLRSLCCSAYFNHCECGSMGFTSKEPMEASLSHPDLGYHSSIIWLLSFTRRTITWRKVTYRIHNGILVPVTTQTHTVVEPSRQA